MNPQFFPVARRTVTGLALAQRGSETQLVRPKTNDSRRQRARGQTKLTRVRRPYLRLFRTVRFGCPYRSNAGAGRWLVVTARAPPKPPDSQRLSRRRFLRIGGFPFAVNSIVLKAVRRWFRPPLSLWLGPLPARHRPEYRRHAAHLRLCFGVKPCRSSSLPAFRSATAISAGPAWTISTTSRSTAMFPGAPFPQWRRAGRKAAGAVDDQGGRQPVGLRLPAGRRHHGRTRIGGRAARGA